VLIGLHVADFSWPGGPAGIAPVMERIVSRSEEIGVHSFWPMDHFFQISFIGPPEEPMLEAYAQMAWVAGRTRRMQLGGLVTGVVYRHPGVLVKEVTTLDVLSGGRAWLGIGAAWNEEEARGLGIPFPGLAERFERLEEVLVIARRMFDGDETPFEGRHYRLERPLSSPAPVRRVPILVGGSGEKRTLRLVAEHADACNLFDTLGLDVLRHKLEVLRGHCEDVGRPYDEIVRTTLGPLGSPSVAEAVDRFGTLAELGVDLAMLDLPDPLGDSVYELLADVIAQIAPLGRPVPEALQLPV
jgi:F420-dependent oxidoreductase-like protein